MIERTLAAKMISLAQKFQVVTLTGPRQSGKTTLVKAVFPDFPYVSLEEPDIRQFALADPRGFLSNYPNGAILDEIQNTPELFSYIQGLVDANRQVQFILTGSSNFLPPFVVGWSNCNSLRRLKICCIQRDRIHTGPFFERRFA
mgnify:CR=1 FL=1